MGIISKDATVGLQFGDEGKGKVDDFLIAEAENHLNYISGSGRPVLIYRYQGGANAGHTVRICDETYKLHQVSSGILSPSTFCLCGTGMVITPEKLMSEIQGLLDRGIDVEPHNFGISSKAHVTLAHHTDEDAGNFNQAEHTSTGNGILQTYRDKAARIGIRFVDFLDKALMIGILKNKIFPDGMPAEYGSPEEFASRYDAAREFLSQYLVQEQEVFSRSSFKYLLAESAQGVMLDLDHGLYPGTTSSTPTLIPGRPSRIFGVVKLYVSSVGIGDRPFVTEMPDELQDQVREAWGEYGVSTGKKRHIGWFDAVAAKYAMQVAGVDHLVGTCLDRLEVLGRLGETIKVAKAYIVKGTKHYNWDTSFDRRDTLWGAEPVFEEFKPWTKTLEQDGQTLTPNAARYVNGLEEMLGMRFAMIGTGQEHNDMIVRQRLF